jgi:glycosyltransferase involved in cell wall biosynthesis
VPDKQDQIHLINPLWDATGGSEGRTLALYNLLKDSSDVFLWSRFRPAPFGPDPRFLATYPIRELDLLRFNYPKKGTFIFVGAYFGIGRWLMFSRPKRIVLIINTAMLKTDVVDKVKELSFWGLRNVEIVYASDAIKEMFSFPGIVQPSIIDIKRFSPNDNKIERLDSNDFTVGRLSRDVRVKHHHNDPAFYRSLVEHNIYVKIMGGACLVEEIGIHDKIELIPAGTHEAHTFLQNLDCFYYRTSDNYFEASGRVVVEAMACGLPVICHSHGGHIEIIENGTNGFVFDNESEAFQIIMHLKNNPGLRYSIGNAARKTIERIYSAEAMAEILNFYHCTNCLEP